MEPNVTHPDAPADESSAATIDVSAEASSRRHLLTAGALAAAAGVVAGVTSSQRASAADGGAILIGESNDGTNETVLTAAGFSSIGQPDDFGLYGESTGENGFGVDGFSDEGTGVAGTGGFGVWGDGVVGVLGTGVVDVVAGNGIIGLIPTGTVTPTSDGGAGLLRVASNGTLWFGFAPGKWMELGGGTGSGAFHAINPVRVYDSRSANPQPGKIRKGQSRLVSIADGRNPTNGAVTTPDAVPAGARAVTFNLTVVNTEGRGNLAVVPGSATGATASTINWPANNIGAIANGSVSHVDPNRRVRVFCAGSGATDFVLDVTGYYR
jgi:hypothetical protein